MHYWLLLTPLIGALLGWWINSLLIFVLFQPLQPKKMIGITIQGLFFKLQPQIAKQIGQYVASLFSFEAIKEKVKNSENIERLMPMVEAEIDHFLRNKLGEQMPMISMLIGEKTIQQLKGIFVEEIKTLFPKIIANYLNNLETDINIAVLVTAKIESISANTINQFVKTSLHQKLRWFRIIGAFAGFIIAFIQVIIVLLLQKQL